MRNKINQYLISGIILFYFAFSDEEFEIFYNGVALCGGIVAFSTAYFQYKKVKPDQ